MASPMITLKGTLPKLKAEDAARLAVYFVRGSEIVAQSSVQADGSFRADLSRDVVTAPSAFALEAVVGPAGMVKTLQPIEGLQRVRLARQDLEKANRDFVVSTSDIRLTNEILRIWWEWCRRYCVNGTLIGANGCPVPGAQVTVYSVGWDIYGFTKAPRATVTTDKNGHFTACFTWCTFRFCWPCWPVWWLCWPWWWEWDILHIIETLERVPVLGPGPVEQQFSSNLALMRPAGNDLVRGQGFTSARVQGQKFAPDAERTALIRRKLSNASIRRLFPWWWWCCDDPNIIFSASQGPDTILQENPATDTRWCFANDSSVTLVANDEAITACAGDPPPESGFAWTRVGNITVDKIHEGYADGFTGTDTSDLAFASSLDIYGGFAPGSGVSYYQVAAGQWTGDPARGGTAPASSTPISADLYNYIFIYNAAATLVFAGPIKMGPFTDSGLTNLYTTEQSRPTAPTGTGLDPMPAVPAGGFLLWAYEGLKVSTGSSSLIGGSNAGSVDLTMIGYDAGFASAALVPDAPLTLTIDNTGITTAEVNNVTPYTASHGTPPQTGTGDCPAYDIGPGGYVTIDVTVNDVNGHLYEYEVDAEYGHGHTATVTPPGVRGYSQSPATFPGGSYQAPNTAQKSFGGGEEIMTYYPPVNCCYEFRIRAGKRVTDGYNYPTLGDYDFQTISLKVSS